MGKPESAVVIVELLLMLEQVYIWRLQRENAPKQEKQEQSEYKELPQVTYPKGENTCDIS